MAIYDWNNNGKDDMMDNFIEYNIYRETMEGESKNNYTSGGGSCSGLVAFLITISGLIIQAFLYVILDVEIDNIPGIILVIVWIGIDVLVAMGAASIGWLK